MGSLGASHRWPNQQADREEARFAGNHRQDSRKEHVQETFCYEPGGCRSNRLEEWLGRRFIAVLLSIIISGPYVAKTFASQRAKIEKIFPRSSRPCEVLAPQVVFRIALSKSRSSKAKLATWASSPTVTPLEWYHPRQGGRYVEHLSGRTYWPRETRWSPDVSGKASLTNFNFGWGDDRLTDESLTFDPSPRQIGQRHEVLNHRQWFHPKSVHNA